MNRCPTDIVKLIHSFNRHPFQVGTIIATSYITNVQKTCIKWLDTAMWQAQLHAIGWQHNHLAYEVIRVEEEHGKDIVYIQGFCYNIDIMNMDDCVFPKTSTRYP